MSKRTNKKGSDSSAILYKVGERRLFRNVSRDISGRVVKVFRDDVVIDQAELVTEIGSISDVLKNREFKASEKYPPTVEITIGLGALVESWVISPAEANRK